MGLAIPATMATRAAVSSYGSNALAVRWRPRRSTSGSGTARRARFAAGAPRAQSQAAEHLEVEENLEEQVVDIRQRLLNYQLERPLADGHGTLVITALRERYIGVTADLLADAFTEVQGPLFSAYK